MARVNITEKIWYDPQVKNYVMLDVTEDIERPKPITLDSQIVLEPKDEYHCTLVAAGKLSSDQDAVRELIADISDYFQSDPNAVQFNGLGPDYYVCHKGDESTLIVSAVIIGLDGLRDIVRKKFPGYGESIPHITLLKSENSQYGIGINSPADLSKYCEKINRPAGL